MSGSWKLVLVMGGCFVLGVMVGTRLPSSEVSQGVAPVISREKKAVSEPKLADFEQGFIAGDSQEEVSANEPSPFARKVARVASLKESGTLMSVPPFMYDRIDPTFIMMFDLTEHEVSQLEGALLSATKRYQDMQMEVATGEVTEDGNKLIVNVPQTPETGGKLYDDLLFSFESVLGEDRFELFNALSRQHFDERYDSFGLNTVTYEIDLTPEKSSMDTHATFRYQYISVNPDGVTGRTNGGRSTADGLIKQYPLLENFFHLNFRIK